MDDAAAELDQRLGPDPATWRWGALHTLTLSEQTLGQGAPQPVLWALNQSPIEVPGGTDAVEATSWNGQRGYQAQWGPSMRMVVDLSDLDSSTWVDLTGNSGHPFSPHYTDQSATFAADGTFPWAFSPAAVQASAIDRLELRPQGSGSAPLKRCASPPSGAGRSAGCG